MRRISTNVHAHESKRSFFARLESPLLVLGTVCSLALLLGCGEETDDMGAGHNAASIAISADDGGAGIRSELTDASFDAGSSEHTVDAATSDGATCGVSFATATLESKSNSTVTGSAKFSIVDGVVTLELSVSGASPGEHGVHIHVKGDCSAANGSSAGDHWNPTMQPHGSGSPDETSHLGDLGNITIGCDGKGMLTVSKPEWRLGDGSRLDVLGHAIIFHANQDDLLTQADADAGITPGNSGTRLACGVITAAM
ncbi:MAG: Superoxide dismutase precursor [Myxococcaceae bacterium]|nr:Superoxide dismutase precursor [Myxococcaceae bacterium]